MLSLSALCPDDKEDLERFEFANRGFFELHINARPPSFYEPGGIPKAIEAAQADAEADRAHQFLVRDSSGCLVARVNLTRVRREHFHCAELGYRVAESHTGKGYAGEAVRLVLKQAFGPLGLHRVEAVVSIENIASAKVLLRNNFVQFGRSSRSFHLAGQWHDALHFERHGA